MALADIPSGETHRRFDSWKEIADYLGRDVRTAIRWESLGLPVHRIPGGKGRSVFAFSNEIDAWMSSRREENVTDSPEPLPAIPAVAVTPHRPKAAPRIAAIALVSVVALTLTAVTFIMQGRAAENDIETSDLIATPTEISVALRQHTPRVIHKFTPDLAVYIAGVPVRVTTLNPDKDRKILAGIAFYMDHTGAVTRTGELLAMTTNGDARWRFAVDDALTFGDSTFRGPWSVSAWEASAGAPRSRIAVAAHDWVWWASIVAVLDDQGRRQGTFVNPGWIESLLWMSANRLAVGGFNNHRNAAMVALIDPAAADGQAPGTAGTSFACGACPSKLPLFYATFARSELNLLTGSPFNRAKVSRVGDRIFVTTSEIDISPATAIYEFDADMKFISARFSGPYRDLHGQLEREGKLTHSFEQCPERDGPAVHVWDIAAGKWTAAAPLKRTRP